MFERIGFIGCGNMGGALLKAVAKASSQNKLFVSGKGSERAKNIANETGATQTSNESIAKECSLIFLGVKPQVMPEMLSGIEDILGKRQDHFVLVTMAAGLSIESIRKMAGGNYPVIRIMPNLPVSVGEGMTLYCSDGLNSDELSEFLDMMSLSGKMCQLDESLIDAGSVVSGCGPAFVYMFIDALAKAGADCGLSKDKAQLLAAQTLIGSSKLLIESERDPGDLRDAVCSPGGTTIEGVKSLENDAFNSTVSNAVKASYKRTLELKK